MDLVNIAQVLKLRRTLNVFDVETTGTSEQDRIVQISVTLHYLDREPKRWSTLVNPEIPISPEVTEVHGITNEIVKDAPKFIDLAGVLIPRAFVGVDYCGQNIAFDLRKMKDECRRIGYKWEKERDAYVIDTLRLRQHLRPNNLSALYKEATGKDLEGAHDAGHDVAATEIVLAWLINNNDIPREIGELSALLNQKRPGAVDAEGKFMWKFGAPAFNFGKHNGRPLADVVRSDRNYLTGFLLGGDFTDEVKTLVRQALHGIYPVRVREEETPAADSEEAAF